MVQRCVGELKLRVALLEVVELLLGGIPNVQQQLLCPCLRLGRSPGAPEEPAADGRKYGRGDCGPFPAR